VATLLVAASIALPQGARVAQAEEPSSSADAEKKPRAKATRALAVWGPSNLKDGSSVARKVLSDRLSKDSPMPERVLRLSDWLGANSFQIDGSSEAIPCNSEPSEIEVPDGTTEVEQLTDRGVALLDDLEPGSALDSFLLAQQRLPCQQGFLSKEALARLPFYAGIAAYVNGDSTAATNHFRQTASIDAAQRWDPSYPTEPQSTFLSAVQEVVSAPKARVYGDMRGTDYVEVWLDGQRLDLDKAVERVVLPGVHVVQALDSSSRWQTFVRRMDSGETLLLFSANGLEQMILDGPDGALGAVATTTLQERAAREVLTEVLVVRIEAADPTQTTILTFDPRNRDWGLLEAEAPVTSAAPSPQTSPETTTDQGKELPPPLSKKEQVQKNLLRDPRYRSGAFVGLKLFQLHRCKSSETSGERCPSGSPATAEYVGGLVNIDVRIIKGLNLDIRFGMTASDLAMGGTLLPEVGIGLRYRFLTGPLQPYLGGGGDFFGGTTRNSIYDANSVVVYGGVLVYGGVDFEFPDGFRLSVEGGAGAIIQPEDGASAWPMGHFTFGIGRFL